MPKNLAMALAGEVGELVVELEVLDLLELLQPATVIAAATPTATMVSALLRMGGHYFRYWGSRPRMLWTETYRLETGIASS